MATTGVKCFLGGLSYGSSEDSLRNYFSRFGEVSAHEHRAFFSLDSPDCARLLSTTQIEDVHVVRDRATGASKGFGFVKFFDMGVQQRVIDMHEHVIDGRQVMAREAQPQ